MKYELAIVVRLNVYLSIQKSIISSSNHYARDIDINDVAHHEVDSIRYMWL